jgi:pimeloyl-ACP methyl ester carboxylesterase
LRTLAKVIVWTAVVVLALVAVGWLALRRPDISYAELEKRHATPASRYADLPGGIRVHYQDVGGPGRPTVVLVHGYGDSFLTWERVVQRLSPRFRVIALDLPGHGLTRAPANFVAASDNYVPVLEAFAAKAGLQRFTLAGNSLGGGVAWQYALAHPERVSGLVLVDAAGWPDETLKSPPLAFRILMSEPGRWWLKHMETRPITGPALQMDFHDPKLATPPFVRRWVEVQRAPGHRDILMSLTGGPNSVATAERLGRIKAPTLVLHGADDRIIAPASGRKFAQAIPGAKLVIYEKVGHLPQWEVPDRLAADIAGFMNGRAAPVGAGEGRTQPAA